MSKFLSKRFEKLEAYVPGEQPNDKKYIKLNTNESPYSPSPLVLERISSEEVEKLNLYPDPTCSVLKSKIAELLNVEAKNVFLSNGSDDILNFSFMAFCDKEHGAAFPDISYGFYPVYADLYGIPAIQIPLKEDFTIDPKDYFKSSKMTVIANPNAPTGLCLSLDEIKSILDNNKDSVVVIDEAYVDFGGESAVPLINEYDNLLVVRTFSQSRSLAGGRLGFAIANENLIEDLEKIKYSTNPYNINRLTMIAGEASIDSNDYYMEKVKIIMDTREKTAMHLKELGFRVLDSKANFIFAESSLVDGKFLYEELKKKGILVRHFDKERTRNFIRITIGTPEQMEAFIVAVKEILLDKKVNSNENK